MKLREKILNYIKEEKIEPHSKWYFVIKNETIWALWVISILIGAISVSVLIFSFVNIEWELYTATHETFFDFAVDSLPFIWIISLAIFSFVAYKNFKNTKKGYKYSIIIVLLLSILISIVGGGIFYLFGFGKVFDEEIGGRIPLYEPIFIHRQQIWARPEKGLIFGEVIKTGPDFSSFIIKSDNGQEWVIEGSDLSEIDIDILTKFKNVRVVGVPVLKNETDFSTTTMKGCVVFPWKNKNETTCISGSFCEQPIRAGNFDKDNIKNERKDFVKRTNECEGVHSYKFLKDLKNR